MEFLNEEERYLFAHITDLAAQSRRSGVVRFSRFLNERERVVASGAAQIENAIPVFYGGYDGAQRTMCGFFQGTYAEDYPLNSDNSDGSEGLTKRELFPVCTVTFSFRKCDKPTHRDFLGAILGTGLERSMLGDILVAEDYAVLFCTDTAARIAKDIIKVGRCGVQATLGLRYGLPEQKTEVYDRSVSSLRLDCVVSACTNLSRDKSAALIKSGLVSADFSVCQNVSAILKEGTVISVRGYGRFRLSELFGETKKGRLHVKIEKNI